MRRRHLDPPLSPYSKSLIQSTATPSGGFSNLVKVSGGSAVSLDEDVGGET